MRLVRSRLGFLLIYALLSYRLALHNFETFVGARFI